jgi:hypothetical protein
MIDYLTLCAGGDGHRSRRMRAGPIAVISSTREPSREAAKNGPPHQPCGRATRPSRGAGRIGSRRKPWARARADQPRRGEVKSGGVQTDAERRPCVRKPAGRWQMYAAESFAPLGLSRACRRPTAYAVGCILAPLRGFPVHTACLNGYRYSILMTASELIGGKQRIH